MSDRSYNKLFLNTNRGEGSEKIMLGYQHKTKELTLTKDKETYFHVPYYTSPTSLTDTSLILDGAIGAPFPAAADRIFKSKQNYGQTTPHGNPSGVVDGTWFCSWLYKDKKGNLKWMDRYYNPGTLKFNIAIEQLSEGPEYEPNNPVFRDVPSKLMLEPGVMYRYYHAGEKTSQFLVTTFGGISAERLLLDLNEWGTNSPNTAPNTLIVQPIIKTQATSTEIYGTTEEAGRASAPFLNFNNNENVEASLEYSSSYCPTNEFTLGLWTKSPNWSASQTTQLAGNFSAGGGGFGIYIQTLSSYPFFVVPETNYGRLLFINEQNAGFLDKSLHVYSGITTDQAQYNVKAPELVCIDMDQNVILCNSDDTGTLYKLDNAGELIGSSKRTAVPFSLSSQEMPLDLLCGVDDSIWLRTNLGIYTFDRNFVLLKKEPRPSSLSAVSSFRYRKNETFFELDVTENVYDSKFIESTQFYTSRTDGNLYKKELSSEPVLMYKFPNIATSFAIDPFNKLWITHGTNEITVLDPLASERSEPIFRTTVGKDIDHSQKNITFVCQYDRLANYREWKCLVYYPEEYSIYISNMSGQLVDTISIKSYFDPVAAQQMNQSLEMFKFDGRGDFTGYEHKRVFQNIFPYNGEPQLTLKLSLKDRLKSDLTFTESKKSISIANWSANSWQHIAVILKNKTFEVYSNARKLFDLSYTGQYELSYETQPSFFIGSPVGSQRGFNTEVGHPSLIFNGQIEDIKIYDYALDSSDLGVFIKARWLAEDLIWSMPIPNTQYLEKVERVFKNKIPGSKTPFYQLHLRGTEIKDIQTRKIIEDQIKILINSLQPAHVDFLRIHWVD